MGLEFYVYLVAIGLGIIALLWLPVLWGYIYARWKRLSSPKKFAFYNGCVTYGIPTLVGALIIIPIMLVLAKVAPQQCFDAPESWVCATYDFLDDWLAVIGTIATVVMGIFCPVLFERQVWCRPKH